MFDDPEQGTHPFDDDQAFEILRELEQNTAEQIRHKRGHFRVSIKAGVTLRTATTNEWLSFQAKGVTGDISESGCGLLFAVPIRVGDVYSLEFKQAKLALPFMFTRCVRCQLVREGVYNVGTRFFTTISLPENAAVKQELSRG